MAPDAITATLTNMPKVPNYPDIIRIPSNYPRITPELPVKKRLGNARAGGVPCRIGLDRVASFLITTLSWHMVDLRKPCSGNLTSKRWAMLRTSLGTRENYRGGGLIESKLGNCLIQTVT